MFLPSDVVSTTEKPRFFMALMNASLQRRVCSCSLKPLALAPGALGECPPLLVKVVKVVVKHSHSFPRWFFMSRRSSSIVPIRSSILVRVALMSSSLPDTSFNASVQSWMTLELCRMASMVSPCWRICAGMYLARIHTAAATTSTVDPNSFMWLANVRNSLMGQSGALCQLLWSISRSPLMPPCQGAGHPRPNPLAEDMRPYSSSLTGSTYSSKT